MLDSSEEHRARERTAVGPLPPDEVVEVPDFNGYLIPLEGQDPFFGASAGNADSADEVSREMAAYRCGRILRR